MTTNEFVKRGKASLVYRHYLNVWQNVRVGLNGSLKRSLVSFDARVEAKESEQVTKMKLRVPIK